MNTEPNPDPRAEREARLTALLLGELPPAEAAALERELAADPKLAALRDELARAIGLVRQTVAAPVEPAGTQPTPLRLSDERRRKLLAHFQTVPLRPANVTVVDTTARKPRDVRWLIPMAAAVAVMLAGAWLFLPALSMAKRTPKDITVIASRRSVAMDDYGSVDLQVISDPVGYNNVTPSDGLERTTPERQVAFRLPAGATAKPQLGAIVLPAAVGDLADFGVLDRRQPGFAGGQGGGGSGYVPAELGEIRNPIKYAHSSEIPQVLEAHDRVEANARPVRVDPATGAVIPAETAGLPAIAAATSPVALGDDGVKTDFQTRLGTIVNRAASGSGGMVATGEPFALGRLEALAEGAGAKMDRSFGGGWMNGASPASAPNAFYYNGASTPVLQSPDQTQARWGGSSTSGGDAGVNLFTSAVTSTRRDTEKELELIDKASRGLAASPPDAMIDTKFAPKKITDEKGQALGLNWHLGGRPESDEPLQSQSGTAPAASDPTSGSQVTKSGAGTLRLNGGNTFAGGIVLNPGTLTVKGNAPAPEPMVAASPARPQVITAAAPEASGPVPGDLPAVERMFRAGEVDGDRAARETGRANGAVQLKAEVAPAPVAMPAPSAVENDSTFFVPRVSVSALDSSTASGRAGGGRVLGGASEPNSLSEVTREFYVAAGASPQSVQVDGRTGNITVRGTESDLALIDEANKVLINAGKPQRPIAQAISPPATPQTPAPPLAIRPADMDKERQLAELEEQQQIRDTLRKRIAQETIDQAIPKSSTVQIIDLAEAGAGEKPSLWGRLSGAISGEVERSARISMDQHGGGFVLPGQAPAQGGYDPYFVRTEAEKIESKLVLRGVIDKLKLDEAWGGKDGNGRKLSREETLERLQDKIEVTKNPTSALLEIRAKGSSAEEAAKIANTVAEMYRDVRTAQNSAMAKRGLAVLNQRLAEQEKLVASAEGELKKLKQPAAVESEPPAPRKPAGPTPVPQPEVLARDNAFSTFSLNVSDVSFKLAAASLAQGQWPDPASVRAEEFLNAFDYRDAEAAPGAPLAFAWERARAPFAHNRDLLRFSLQTAATGRPAGQSLNVVLVLDNSGSMERADRVRIVREALRALAGQFQPSDKLSVITFARTPRLWVDGASGARAAAVAEQVGGLTPEGGTNLEEALRLGYETARRHYVAGGINHVVLLTDGAANLGEVDPASLQQRVETHRRQGIALDCFGIGWEGFNDDLLETLARNGDGRYGFLNSPAEAVTEFAAQLAGALKVAASDVKVQVEFNPRRVTAWRQIGYAKHQLTKEQFRDNTVDAAELAAQESGNALYTVEVNPRGEGPLATVRARFKVPGTNDYREHAWEVPFTGNAVALDEASSAMRLAATAGAFAEWLASSPFAAEVTADRLLEALRGVPDVYGADARPKQLEEMLRQAKQVGGR